MTDFCLQSIFSLPTDVIQHIFTFETCFFYKNGIYIYCSKIPKTDERYAVLYNKIIIIKSFQNEYGVRFYPTVTHHISIYDDDKDPEDFSIELQKCIKMYKTMYW
jgi:hypothetical protein